MLQANEFYVDGSAAREIKYDVYEQNAVLKRKREQRSYFKAKTRMVTVVLILFAVGFLVIFRYAKLIEMNYQISKYNKEYERLRNDNITTRINIEKQLDLQSIREAAITRLGMQKPDSCQIVYLKVPKNDYIEVSEEYKERLASNKNMFEVVFSKISAVVRFLD